MTNKFKIFAIIMIISVPLIISFLTNVVKYKRSYLMTEYFNCATKLQEKTIKEKGFDFWLENRDVYDKPCKDLFGEYVYTMNDLEIFIK